MDAKHYDVYATYDDDYAQRDPFLRCARCNEDLCTVEEGDAFSVLVAVVEEHAAECKGIPA